MKAIDLLREIHEIERAEPRAQDCKIPSCIEKAGQGTAYALGFDEGYDAGHAAARAKACALLRRLLNDARSLEAAQIVALCPSCGTPVVAGRCGRDQDFCTGRPR